MRITYFNNSIRLGEFNDFPSCFSRLNIQTVGLTLQNRLPLQINLGFHILLQWVYVCLYDVIQWSLLHYNAITFNSACIKKHRSRFAYFVRATWIFFPRSNFVFSVRTFRSIKEKIVISIAEEGGYEKLTEWTLVRQKLKLALQHRESTVRLSVKFKKEATNANAVQRLYVSNEKKKTVQTIGRHVPPHGSLIASARFFETNSVMRMPFAYVTNSFCFR